MRAELDAALARDDLPPEAREGLRNVRAVLDADPQARLESVTVVGARPEAVIAFGDPLTADLVVYLLHGTATDLRSLPGWASAAQRLCGDLIRSCIVRGLPRDIAVIVWFGWDSGDHSTARATTHATIGAARLAVDIDRLAVRNPDAHIALVTYSYSTTLLGELFALNLTDRVRTAVSIASAGVTSAASMALSDAISEERLTMYATEAVADTIAPLGRLGQHPIDPRDIAGVRGYSCDGGPAPGVDGGRVTGAAVSGHASQTWTDEYGIAHVGYFDERTQGYLTLVSLLADAVASAR
ncbi:alpha/beta hydrolase [Microbacterium sp. ZW T5_45]|uniref:alpha/beta hydrolase n=1 Tax=Microbacterium sp. ZW T5_45 TaxID=3378080 RepID=UPI0038518FF6